MGWHHKKKLFTPSNLMQNDNKFFLLRLFNVHTNCHSKINLFFLFLFDIFSLFFLCKRVHSLSTAFRIVNDVICAEAASGLVEGRYGHVNSKLIYGTFTTPTNAIAGSAVCAFSLQVSLIESTKYLMSYFFFVAMEKLKCLSSSRKKP